MRQRLGSILAVIIGMTGVVAVLISVLALSAGFTRTVAGTVRDDRLVVLSSGSDSQASSNLSREAVNTIFDSPGIRRDSSGHPIASAEKVLTAVVASRSDGKDAYIAVRGVGPRSSALRPEIKLVAGRWFRPAVHEVAVGLTAQKRFAGLAIGNRIVLRDGEWTVVGTFESEGSSDESGLLADAETLIAAYQSNGFSTVVAQLKSPDEFRHFKDALTSNPMLEVDVLREADYVAVTSRSMHRLLNLIAYFIGTIMAIGALVGALNTMYSAVIDRSTEIATLRALGFLPGAVATAVVLEALLLALLGAGAGVMLAYSLFDGSSVNTISSAMGGSQVVYQLAITGDLVAISVVVASVVGLAGGLLPAVRAARMPIVSALRAD
ncbi:MAG TPA: ABC transporter permease [Povalibacter sp.]|uniref:ABC transporter permease n=1 Tax=Povalibacter sp. TaxID=1962978 RepID=UPI002CAE9827|nr:ABC transporter permease [Povalibacter sp.]HMN47176.1 ABC transporter permease [Povalibacter sp.]